LDKAPEKKGLSF